MFVLLHTLAWCGVVCSLICVYSDVCVCVCVYLGERYMCEVCGDTDGVGG